MHAGSTMEPMVSWVFTSVTSICAN